MSLRVRNVAPPAPKVEQAKKVALVTISSKAKTAKGATRSTPLKEKAPAPAELKEAMMVDVISRRPRRVSARQIASPEIEEEQEGSPEASKQESTHKAKAKEEEELKKKPPIVDDNKHFPQYLRDVLHANHAGSTGHLAAELGGLTAQAFCEELYESSMEINLQPFAQKVLAN
ncbi:unnamed protein product [Calypogeia fissa]